MTREKSFGTSTVNLYGKAVYRSEIDSFKNSIHLLARREISESHSCVKFNGPGDKKNERRCFGKKSLTCLLLDLAEDRKQSRLHPVTVEGVFPANKTRASCSVGIG